MKKRFARKGYLMLLALLVLGLSLWWWHAARTGGPMKETGGPERLVHRAANDARGAFNEVKKETVKLAMETASMAVTGIENGRISVLNKVVIRNPLPVPLNADRLDYSVLINSVKVAEGSYTKPIRVPALGSTTVSLPMEVLVKPMDGVIDRMDAAGKDTATYTFAHTIHTDIPVGGERKIPLNITKELPIVRLPKMKPGGLDIDHIGLKRAALDMTMKVYNPNPFPIRMRDGRYSMTIDGKTTLQGRMKEAVVLPARDTASVPMHMDMRTGRALKMGWKMLLNKDSRYKLSFDGQLRSGSKILGDSPVHFDEEGNLQDLKETIKKVKE